jgi:hypothetical protein
VPVVGHTINVAGVRMQASMQAITEMAFVAVSFGIAMGVLLAAAFAITCRR